MICSHTIAVPRFASIPASSSSVAVISVCSSGGLSIVAPPLAAYMVRTYASAIFREGFLSCPER